MAALENIKIAPRDDGMRLDRWFKLHYPGVGHGELQKLLRTGQVRVDGKRAKAGLRLEGGMEVRIPPQARTAEPPKRRAQPQTQPLGREETAELHGWVIYRDADVVILNKPAGLAVQGGTALRRHLDGMLDALRFGAEERPRLVHRLDKDTSGVLVLARHRQAARDLTAAFRGRETRKLYLAVTAGCPKPRRGKVSLALAKGGSPGAQRMAADRGEQARSAVTLYDTLDSSGSKVALLALMPLTGRTHQLRAHMAAIGTPILGDGKYGGAPAFVAGPGVEKRLHLHARHIQVPRPGGGVLKATAPLPPHMESALKAFGLTLPEVEDHFPRD